MRDKFEYFLNVIHYCIYLEEVWSNKKIDKVIDCLFSLIFKLPVLGKYIQKLDKRHTKEVKEFKFGNKWGLSIGLANHLFGYFYSGYPILISFILGGLILRNFGYISNIVKLIILAVPIGLCYIPAYKAVFTNDRYLKYHKQFEKEGERWHKKWKRITLAFCIGSIFTTLLGICAIWIILLL